MLKAIKSFAANTTYFDPVGKTHFLTNKELWKGRILPLLGRVCLFTLSTAMAFAMAGPASMAFMFAAGCLITPFSYASHLKKLKSTKKAAYDLNTPDGCAQFVHDYPVHAQLPATIASLFASANISTLPIIHVLEKGFSPAISEYKMINKNKSSVLLLPEAFLEGASPEHAASVCAHELGHVYFGHTRAWRNMISVLPISMHVYAGALTITAMGFIAGAGYLLASFAFDKIAKAKISQYNERQCDRFAFNQTGVGMEISHHFSKDIHPFEKNLHRQPILYRSLFKLTDVFEALSSSHPTVKERAEYSAAFENNNVAYSQGKRSELGYTAK